MDLKKSTYLAEWKEKMTEVIRLHYNKDQIGDRRVEEYLDQVIEDSLNDRRLILVNNYNSKISRVTILQLIELIRNNRLICSGGGCLFLPHGQKRNLLIEFILYIMNQRKEAKKRRKQYPKGSDEWYEADRTQLAMKLTINSLYGCLGYPGFIMFNIFLAEAITNQGRHIITSAINAIENFLGDSMMFENPAEIYHVINTIDREYRALTHGISDEAIGMIGRNIDLSNLTSRCVDRFLKHCIFVYEESLVNSLKRIFSRMPTGELLLMYFKNNLMEFSRMDFMKEKIRLLVLMNGPLHFCEDDSFGRGTTEEEIRESRVRILGLLNDIWKMYNLFVHYNHPIFDRLQKAMYLDKTRSLYTDTDSVFVSLDEFTRFIKNEVFSSPEAANMSEDDLNFTGANIALAIVNRMIDAAMKTLCYSLNITPDYAKLLAMKNEFFFSRIMFADKKKRYVSLAMLQEGQKLYDLETGEPGLPEIKGFEFIKSGTKPFVRDFYTKLCMDEILKPKEIDPTRIFKKFLGFKELMEKEIANGNTEFFKQANVKKPEHYKNPYSVQGVTATMLWNALMPEKQLELPIDINIIPIKPLTWAAPAISKTGATVNGMTAARAMKPPVESNKRIAWYKEEYPEAYDRLYRTIYCNSNPAIQHMNMSSIAVPKNPDYEIPEFIKALYDIESVINQAMGLGIPLLRSVGIQSFQVSTSVEHASNLVSL